MTVDEILGGSGQSLFHYTTLAAALEHIVPTRKLRLSPFSSMRDPRESRTWAITGTGYQAMEVNPDSLREDTFRWVDFNGALHERKNFINVLSLTRDDPAERKTSSAPFGRGFAHPRLWEQYADNHHGVCLCFDLASLIDELAVSLAEVGRVDHGPVVYEDAVIAAEALTVTMNELRERGVEAAVSNHVRAHIAELFFTKLKDWETEMEYRFVVETDDTEPILASVRRSLRAVILGEAVSPFYQPAFTVLCDPTNTAVLRMNWNHAKPHLAKIGTPPEPTVGLDAEPVEVSSSRPE